MPNHVIYDRIWESRKLRECSRDAALAYPWIYLVADDYGRFEFNARRVWGKVFSGRHDITIEDVAGWLDEYARIGLLTRYHVDLAHWTGFKQRPPSKCKPSNLLDPADFAGLQQIGSKTAAEMLRDGSKTAAPNGTEREQNGNVNVTEREGEPAAARPEPLDVERYGLPGEREAVEAEARSELDALHAVTSQPRDELLAQHSNTGRGALVRLEGAPLRWLKVTRDRLKAARLLAQQQTRDPPGLKFTAKQPPPEAISPEAHAESLRRIEELKAARKAGGS